MFKAKAIAQQIAKNAADVHFGRIDWETFSARQFAAWKLVDQGELSIIGSPCAKRMAQVHKHLRAIQTEAV